MTNEHGQTNDDLANSQVDQDQEKDSESIPDGIGTNYDDLAVMFAMQHDTMVAKNG